MAGKGHRTGDQERMEEESVDALVERGLVRYSRGEIHDALSDWEHALALDPDCEPARRYIDEVSRHLETLDVAVPEEDGMDELFPLAAPHGSHTDSAGRGPSSMPAPMGLDEDAPATGSRRVRAADTIEEGWPLVEEAPAGESGPNAMSDTMRDPDSDPRNDAAGAAAQATAGTYRDLHPLASSLREVTRPPRHARAPIRDTPESAASSPDTWNDEWTRDATMERHLADIYATAVAPTMELPAPDSNERLLDVLSELHRVSTESEIQVPDLDQASLEAGPAPRLPALSSEGDTVDDDLALIPDMVSGIPAGMPAAGAGKDGNRARAPIVPVAPVVLPPVVIEELTPPRSRPTSTPLHARGTVHDSTGMAGAPVPDESSTRARMHSRTGSRDAGARSSTNTPAGAGCRLPGIQRLRAQLDAEVPLEHTDARGAEDTEDVEDAEVLRRRVSWLIERAEAECVNDNLEAAITALELAFSEQPDSAVAQRLIHRHIDTLLDIYERYIDNPQAVPVLAISPAEFHVYAIDSRAAFLLSRVDGLLTVEDILDVSGMTNLEAYRYLCSMLCQGILTLR